MVADGWMMIRCDYSCVTMAVKLSDEIEFVYGNRFGSKYSMILKKVSSERSAPVRLKHHPRAFRLPPITPAEPVPAPDLCDEGLRRTTQNPETPQQLGPIMHLQRARGHRATQRAPGHQRYRPLTEKVTESISRNDNFPRLHLVQKSRLSPCRNLHAFGMHRLSNQTTLVKNAAIWNVRLRYRLHTTQLLQANWAGRCGAISHRGNGEKKLLRAAGRLCRTA